MTTTAALQEAGEVAKGAAAAKGIAEAISMKPNGYKRRMLNEAHRRKVAAAGALFARAAGGDWRAMGEFKEAMSTSDFPLLFGDFLYRSLAARYQQATPIWQSWATRDVNRDFRPKKIIDVFGAGATLDDVGELQPYPERPMSESEFSTTLGKKGGRIQFSWEDMVNDDLSALQRGPADLARGATNTEDKTATSVIATATGPAAYLGTPDTAPLTTENLEAAIQKITNAVDGDGNPIVVDDPVLVVPQALALTAQNIVRTTQFQTQTGSGNGQVRRDVNGNGLSVTPRIVVNRWLTVVDKDAKAPTTWYLLPPADSIRPAVYLTFLAGYETPDLRMKADAGVRPGGGAIDPAEGSFDNDSIEYRVRHVVGGNEGFTSATYVSTGS